MSGRHAEIMFERAPEHNALQKFVTTQYMTCQFKWLLLSHLAVIDVLIDIHQNPLTLQTGHALIIMAEQGYQFQTRNQSIILQK